MFTKKILSIVLATVLLFSMSAYFPSDVSATSRSKQAKDTIQRPAGQIDGRQKAINTSRRAVPNTVRDQVYAQRQLVKQNQRTIVSLIQERQTKMQELRKALVTLRQSSDQTDLQNASLIRTRLRTIQENEAGVQKTIKPARKEQGVTKAPTVNTARVLAAQETRIRHLRASLVSINELLTLTR